MPVKEKRFMMLGDTGVGKTSLLRSTQCEVNPDLPTVYFKFLTGFGEPSSLELEGKKCKKKKVLMSFWDVPGDENDFEDRRKALYPCLDAVIIVFSLDDKQTLENGRKLWYKQLRRSCGRKIPVILVGNKLDLRDAAAAEGLRLETLVSNAEGLKAAEKMKAYAYVECSALNGEETLSVFKFAIKSVVKKHKHCVVM